MGTLETTPRVSNRPKIEVEGVKGGMVRRASTAALRASLV
jgi:hypothetical protein